MEKFVKEMYYKNRLLVPRNSSFEEISFMARYFGEFRTEELKEGFK